MSHRRHVSLAPSHSVVWMLALVCLGVLGSAGRVSTQGGARQDAWAWKPALPTGDDGLVHVLPVRGNVYMLVGAGGNITVQAGEEGVLLVDTGLASMSDKVLAAVQTISRRPLRYIINTNEREEHTGGNETIAAAGQTIPFRPTNPSHVSRGDREQPRVGDLVPDRLPTDVGADRAGGAAG